jgi:diketogulonate reductase-like aldo/keto reductase
MNRGWTRRRFISATALAGISPSLALAGDNNMQTREIPVSNEPMPVIGLGTYNVFDVDSSAENISARGDIVDMLFDAGGSVIDTSPMYNRSEQVIGDIFKSGVDRQSAFTATKVWTDGKRQGEQQMTRSAELMGTDVIDLMQVHNLRDLDTHMATIRDWQSDGRIRYNGVTHYRDSAQDDLERVIKSHKPQFIQINYSLGEHAADDSLLPMAADEGVGVLINRPFMSGRLFRAVGQNLVPDWAREFADSWGQFFLKFIVSHPAITCVIPATSKMHHMIDNLAAGFGIMPDEPTRQRMIRYIQNI